MRTSSILPPTDDPAPPDSALQLPRSRRWWRRSWGVLHHWMRANTFAPDWLPRQMQHPLAGYLIALFLQLLATGLDLFLVQFFGDFALPGVPIVLVIICVGLFWGIGPSLVALIVGATLLEYAVLPPRFAFEVPDVGDVLEIVLLMLLGFLIAFTASQQEQARRRAEELARLLRQAHLQADRERLRLQQVLEVLPAGVHISDLEGQLLEMNATMRALWELETTPVGQRVRTLGKSWQRTIDPSAPTRRGPLARALETGETSLNDEVEIETQFGQHKTILHSAAPMRDETGSIVGGVVANIDITERKQLEQALRLANWQMDAFLGIVSHELKTPLTILKLQLQAEERRAQRLSSTVAEGTEERSQVSWFQQEPLARMEQQVGRLERLVSDLLDVSRIRAGKLDLCLESVDLAALVRQLVEDHHQATSLRDIQTELPERQPVLVLADADRLRQVVTNYLTNALKYSPADQPVDVGLGVEARQARVWVRDRGPGIPGEEQERIWDRFYRVEGISVQSGTGVGLGLGLSICREIIERHHGQVGVQSVPGAGATFWFTVPLQPLSEHERQEEG